MSRTMKALIGTTVLGILAIAVCLLFIVAGPRPADPEGFRAQVRGFFGMRDSRIPRCHELLVLTELAKSQWAADYGKTSNDVPTWDDVRPYLPDWSSNLVVWTNSGPICPKGGTYMMGRVSEHPRCSIGGYNHAVSP